MAGVTPGPRRRRSALALPLLVVLVTAVHLWLADGALQAQMGWGAAALRDQRPPRIEVALVRRLQQTTPPPPAPMAPLPRAAAPRLAPFALAASAPVLAELPAPAPEPVVQQPEAAPPPAALPEVALAEAAPAASAASEAAAAASMPAAVATVANVASQWPPSTRLDYSLTGNYRGPIEGQAQVHWLLQGTRYQVHLDVSVGPPFAPLLQRRHGSTGELTDRGLQPSRYDEEFQVVFRDPRRLTLHMDADTVRFPNGRSAPRPPGLQDSASQFVQLVWLFTTQPGLLQPGRSIDIPLALPRYIEIWTYDVLAAETLATPAGAIDTVHVKPRREPRPGVDLTAEVWVAPSLQYLPVRILIRQDAQTYVDLLLKELPLQAAAPAPPASAGASAPTAR
jgi:hypothetical protein